jgi:iron complex outermembrane recepter protein
LPSLSVRARPADDIQVRLVVGKSITRPEFDQLNPAAGLFRAGNTTLGTGTGGNANLQRIKSDNFDGTVEWYFARTGSLTLSAFRRNLDGYIVSFASDEFFADPNGTLVRYSVTRPRNTGKSRLQGVEVAYQQFFDFLPGPLSGFGAQANFTYSDSKYTDPLSGQRIRLPQVSKYSYNLVAIYEKYGFSARLAYNWRSRFTDSYIDFAGNFNDRNAITVAPLKFLDFSASYALTDNITLTVDATNILDETYRDQFGTDGVTPRDTRAFDRTIGGGVRVRF